MSGLEAIWEDTWSEFWAQSGYNSDASSSGGLSTGAKAGIGIGVTLGVLTVASIVILLCLRKRKQIYASVGLGEGRKHAELDGSDSEHKPSTGHSRTEKAASERETHPPAGEHSPGGAYNPMEKSAEEHRVELPNRSNELRAELE